MDDTMKWTIYPHEGVGPLRFGMSPAEVEQAGAALGPPARRKARFDGSVREFRDLAQPSLGYVNDRLRDADFSKSVYGLEFEGNLLFEMEPEATLRLLFSRNGGALVGLGSVLFLSIGINCNGFYDEGTKSFPRLSLLAEDTRNINVFSPHAFDELLSEFEPLEL